MATQFHKIIIVGDGKTSYVSRLKQCVNQQPDTSSWSEPIYLTSRNEPRENEVNISRSWRPIRLARSLSDCSKNRIVITPFFLKLKRGNLGFSTYEMNRVESKNCSDIKGAIIMFNMNEKRSFNNVSYWLKQIRKVDTDIPVILCGRRTVIKEGKEGKEDKRCEKKRVTSTQVLEKYPEYPFFEFRFTHDQGEFRSAHDQGEYVKSIMFLLNTIEKREMEL